MIEEKLRNIKYSIEKIKNNNDNGTYKVSIMVPMSLGWIERMKFITETSTGRDAHQLHHLKNEDGYVCFESEVVLSTKAIYHYYFSFEANHEFIYYKQKNIGNYQSVSREDMWKMSVNFKVPDWAKGKMMYHIFVDRFKRGETNKLTKMPNRIIHESWDEDIIIGPDNNGMWNTDFYGGDLKGIIEKIPYIKSLGISILYLSPIVCSQSNHRYDTADYEIVDPYAGSNDDLKKLCDEAHKMGMKVILDAVFNHTGNDSKYFNEFNTYPELGAYQSMESKYFPFYKKFISNNHVYFDYWWGMKNLPVCDGNSKDWQNYIYGNNGIIDKWFKLGIDGLRLDVADELTDEFIEGIRNAVKRNKEDGFILGEVWKNPMRMNRTYIESGKGMDSVMNYPLINALIRYFKYSDVNLLRSIFYELINEYPNDTLLSLMNFTSTHDITRAINIFSCNEFQYSGEWSWNLNGDDREFQKNYKLTKEQYDFGKKVYQAYLYTLAFLPGNLSIFYGDEIGMEGLGNLANRRAFTWDKIDLEILNFVKKIGSIRNNERYLEKAKLEPFDVNEKLLMFKRITDEIESLTIINRTGDKQNLIIPSEFERANSIYPLNNSNTKELNEYGGITLKKIR